MPGAVVHTIIAEQLPRTFEDEGLGQVANALRPHRTALVYGAQGPDPFFFNLNDWLPWSVASTIIKWWNFRGNLAYAFYELKEPIIEIKRELKEKANDVILKAAEHSDLIEKIKNLVIKLRETGMLASRITRGFVKKTVLDKTDPFGFYVSPVQTCGRQLPSGGDTWQKDHKLWSWFDTLHCRRTGDFVTELLDIATAKTEGHDGRKAERDRLWSYATGYLSHLAADVVGHAYVNSITGGPYRLQQAQRHTTQERIMDVWAYDYYYSNPDLDLDLKTVHEKSRRDEYATKRYYMDEELVNSGMHKNFQFTAGRLEPRQWERDPSKPLNKSPEKPINATLKLPDEIGENFVTAVEEVYPKDFGPLNVNEVDISYRYWYKFFWGATTTFSPAHPDELPGDATINEDVKKEQEDLKEAADELGDVFESDGSGGGGNCLQGETPEAFAQDTMDCLENAAESIKNFFENLGEAIAKLFKEAAQLAAAIGQCIVEAGLDCTIGLVNYALQKLYEKLWSAYKRLLMLVTAMGFSYMYTDGLQHQQLENFYDPTARDGFDNTVRDHIVKPGEADTGYPRVGMDMADTEVGDVLDGLQNVSHLVVPVASEIEEPGTIPGPDLYGTNGPEVFITDPDDKIQAAMPSGQDPPLWDWIARPRRNSSDPSRDGENPTLADFLDGWKDTNERIRGMYVYPVLGNAVDFTVELYKQYREHGDVPNLNMSGDRAIGFPTWASTNGCERIPRDRWQNFHGDEVPWLRQPVGDDPDTRENEPEVVFVPDIDQYY